jgi:hypothetical protein
MAESVYKVVELVGTSTVSWEKAAAAAVKLASQSLRDLRVAEVTKLDVHIIDGKVVSYRAKMSLSFKYESSASEVAAPAKRAPRGKPMASDEDDEVAAAPAPKKKAARKGKKKA